MKDIRKYLSLGDLRSIGQVDKIIPLIKDQKSFDILFSYLYSDDRKLVMQAADAIEKVTIDNPKFLFRFKNEILKFLTIAKNKEFKWHLALLVTRLKLNENELEEVGSKLADWLMNKSESRIVRVNSLQSLHELARRYDQLKNKLMESVKSIRTENIPSINARLKKLNL